MVPDEWRPANDDSPQRRQFLPLLPHESIGAIMNHSAVPRLAVFGLGYVGAVSAACFAKLGFPVIGVDVNPAKVAALNEGRSPVLEEGVADLVAEQRAA